MTLLFLSLNFFATYSVIDNRKRNTSGTICVNGAGDDKMVSVIMDGSGNNDSMVAPQLTGVASRPIRVAVRISGRLLRRCGAGTNLALRPVTVRSFMFVAGSGGRARKGTIIAVRPKRCGTDIRVGVPRVSRAGCPCDGHFTVPMSVADSSGCGVLDSPSFAVVHLDHRLIASIKRFSHTKDVTLMPGTRLEGPVSG